MTVSFQCMTKFTTNKKKKKNSEQGVGQIYIKGKEESSQKNHPTEAKGEGSRRKIWIVVSTCCREVKEVFKLQKGNWIRSFRTMFGAEAIPQEVK